MKNFKLLLLLSILGTIGACSSTKKTAKANENSKEEEVVVAEQSVSDTSKSKIDFEKENENRLANQVKLVKEQVDAYPDSLVIEWERGGCYGRCPIYKVRIYQSGYAEYESVRWTDREDGLYTTQFSELEIEEICARAKKIGFNNLESFYDTEVSDLPSYFVYINKEGVRKGIRDRRSGPDELKQFVTGLDEMLKAKTLVK